MPHTLPIFPRRRMEIRTEQMFQELKFSRATQTEKELLLLR